MRLSIDELRQKQASVISQSGYKSDSYDFISDDDSQEIRGGDKEYNPPLYEHKHKSIWQRANILLDNIK
jgi:hypothetical protein